MQACSRVCSLLFVFFWQAIVFAAPRVDIVVLDEDDPIGSNYYDASVATVSGKSQLIRSGPYQDKLPVDKQLGFSGKHSAVLKWKSAPEGSWRVLIANAGFARKNLKGYDVIELKINAASELPGAALPRIGFESTSNVSSPPVGLGEYMSTGVDGDLSTWQSIRIPIANLVQDSSFNLERFKGIYLVQSIADNVDHALWLDNIRIVSAESEANPILVAPPAGIIARPGDKSVVLHWERSEHAVGYNVYRLEPGQAKYERITESPVKIQSFADINVENGRAYRYRIHAVGHRGHESASSEEVMGNPTPFQTDNRFLDFVQQTAFDYFWYEANPANGLIRDRSQPSSPASIAAVGFGLTALGIAVDHGWISREQACQRSLITLKTLWNSPQGTNAYAIGHKGWFYHFIEMDTAERAWQCELSSIDTVLLLGGVIYARHYFDHDNQQEAEIRRLADQIVKRVDWKWMTNGKRSFTMGWKPESGFLESRWVGYNEAMLLYLLGMGAAENSVPADSWQEWTSGYKWETHYGQSFVTFPPLFGHQYSHCWVDFRNIADPYMRRKGINYFENSRRATLAQRAYCVDNPKKFAGYGEHVWGLTACDGPGVPGYHAYMARGTPPPEHDDGTIPPTAMGGSLAFTPEISIPSMRYLYDRYREKIWTGYGFCDAFNLTLDWWASDVLGIDQGPILIMIENHRTGNVWKTFMKSPEVQRGLKQAGFQQE